MNTLHRTRFTFYDVTNEKELHHILEKFPIQNTFFIYDHNLKAPLFPKIQECLEASLSISGTFLHDGTEPTTRLVDEIRQMMRQLTLDSIVAVGGGSTLDLAKALSVLHFSDLPTSEAQSVGFAPKQKLFTVNLPTTPGSGAEATKSAVLTNLDLKVKRGVNHEMVLPDLAILMPGLMRGIPTGVFVASILDGLTHALESHIGQQGNSVTNLTSQQALTIYLKQIDAIVQTRDFDILDEVLLASNLAGFSICNSETGPVHALAYPLSEYLGFGHGQAIGLVLPAVLNLYGSIDQVTKMLIEGATGLSLSEFTARIRAIYASFVQPSVNKTTEAEIEVYSKRSLELTGAIANSPIPWNVEYSEAVYLQLMQDLAR